VNNNVLEFYVKMKDLMSGGLAKLAQTSQGAFNKIQGHIDQVRSKNKVLASSFDVVAGAIKKVDRAVGASGAVSYLRNLKNQLSSMGGGIFGGRGGSGGGGGGGGMLGMLGGGLGKMAGIAGIVGLLAGGAALGKSSISSAMEFGMTKKSFSVLTGSKERGEGLANNLNKLQQDTVLGPEVFKSAQTMMSFGIKDSKVVDNIKMLGDVSMGNSEKMSSLTLAFSQMSAAGKLTGQDLLQFINAGFNPLQEISKKTGISIGDLKKKMEDGAISSGMVENAFKSATSEGGLFYNMLNQIADTPAGKMQKLQGQFESLKVRLGDALMPIAERFLDLADRVMPYLETGINAIAGAVSSLSSPTGQWSGYLETAKSIVMTVFNTCRHVIGVVWGVVGGIVQWAAKSELLQDIFSGIGKFISFIWGLVSKIADLIGWLWNNVVKPILDKLEKAYVFIKRLLGFSGSDVSVENNVTTTTSATPAGSGGGMAGMFQRMASMKKDAAGGAGGGDYSGLKDNSVAQDITSGGPRVININGVVMKLAETLQVSAANADDFLNQLEPKMEEFWLRLLNSGAKVQP
jgi:tape measure domain-containing protein